MGIQHYTQSPTIQYNQDFAIRSIEIQTMKKRRTHIVQTSNATKNK